MFTQKMNILDPKLFLRGGGADFHGVSPLMTNTIKTSFHEDLVKIGPAIAEFLCQKKKKHNGY